jgi:hypothetical protein
MVCLPTGTFGITNVPSGFDIVPRNGFELTIMIFAPGSVDLEPASMTLPRTVCVMVCASRMFEIKMQEKIISSFFIDYLVTL